MIQRRGSEAPSVDRFASSDPQFDFSRWTDLPKTTTLPIQQPVRLPPKPMSRSPFVERALAALMLVPLAPFLALIALVIKLEAPRAPILYRQVRVGLNRRQRSARNWNGKPDRRRFASEGQPFQIWKFRSMVPDAESRTGPVWASQHDPRITRIGQILRQLRLDELPQLVNVVQGHMRLIGPRPERPEFVRMLAQDMPDYLRRLAVLPGITGLAQVEREYDSNVDDVRRKLGYDLFYVDHRCWILDLKIILKTVDVVVRGRGAH